VVERVRRSTAVSCNHLLLYCRLTIRVRSIPRNVWIRIHCGADLFTPRDRCVYNVQVFMRRFFLSGHEVAGCVPAAWRSPSDSSQGNRDRSCRFCLSSIGASASASDPCRPGSPRRSFATARGLDTENQMSGFGFSGMSIYVEWFFTRKRRWPAPSIVGRSHPSR
jgi:hypothetical protein